MILFYFYILCFLIQVNYALEYPNEYWMRDNYEYLKNHTLLDLSFPATHDSGAYSLTSTWSPGGFGNKNDNSYITLTNQFGFKLWKVVRPWSICHSGSILEQLYYGIRAFDIRAMWDGDWYIHHNLRGLQLKIIFENISSFAKTHPSEILILDVSHIDTYSRPGYNITELYDMMNTFFNGTFIDSKVNLTQTTVSELLNEGKHIMIRLEDKDTETLYPNYWNFDTNTEGVYSNKDIFPPMKEFNNKQIRQLGGHGKFFVTFWTLTPNVYDFVFSMIPCYQRHDHLLSMTRETAGNRLTDWMQENRNIHLGNIIYIDNFKEVDIVGEIIRFTQRNCYNDYNLIARRDDKTDCYSLYEAGACELSSPQFPFMKEHCRLSCNLC